MSISSTVLALLCLGTVLGKPGCPSINQDASNGGKCGPTYGRCNPYIDTIDNAFYCNVGNGWW